MASLSTRLQDLAVRAATESKALRTLISGNLTDLSTLDTTAKNNLIASINEIVGRLDAIEAEAGAQIADGSSASTTETWSITKIAAEIADAADGVKEDILGGAGPAYDTLQELKALLDETDTDLTSITTALGNRVRTDTAAQSLTTTEQGNARTNIGAVAAADVGNTDQNLVAVFEAALV